MSNIEFFGWVADDKGAVNGKMVWKEYKPKTLQDDDVTIKVECCGICASDLHTLSSGWAPANYPLVVGHEIIGTIVELGSKVKNFKIGQRVGVGAQSDSCLKCPPCEEGSEPYCLDGVVGTYNGKFHDGTGSSYGGYALYNRTKAHFAIPIPDGIPSEVVAPLCCGGVTAFSPLKDNNCGAKDVKRIGIVALGGIGHFGTIFARALGAEQVVVFSHSDSKKDLAMQLGATDFVKTSDPDFWKPFRKNLDLILVTSNNPDMPITSFVSMLRRGGKCVFVGIPEEPCEPTPITPLIRCGAFIGGSAIGSPGLIREMLQLVADKNLSDKFLIETRPMSDANQAILDMAAGKPRFRYVLKNDA